MDSKKKNILVTGAAGQLGLSLRKIAPDYPSFGFLFTDMPEGDITDRARIERIVRENEIEVIVNCAAYTAVDRAESDEDTARQINAQGPRTLAEIARDQGLALVHVSTDYVFPGTGNTPLSETDLPDPLSAYGRTKLEGEKAVEASGCDAAIVRTAWLYSEFGNNFVKTMLRVGKERGAVNVVYDQTGTPTYATSLARAILKIVQNGIKGFDLYHYTDEGVTSWYDFAQSIFALYGLDVTVNAIRTREYPAPATRPVYSVLSKTKAKAAGIDTPYWRDALKSCITLLKQTEK